MGTYEDAKRNLLQIGIGGLPGSGPVPDEKYNDISTAYDAHPAMPMVTGNVLEGPSKYINPDAQMAEIGRNAAQNAEADAKLRQDPNVEYSDFGERSKSPPLISLLAEKFGDSFQPKAKPGAPKAAEPTADAPKTEEGIPESLARPAEEPSKPARSAGGISLDKQAENLGFNLTSKNKEVLSGKQAKPAAGELPYYKQETLNELRSQREIERSLVSQEALNQAQAAGLRGAAARGYTEDILDLKDKEAVLVANHDKEAKAAEARITSLQEEKKNFKINPSRLFKSENAFQLAMYAIATVLGGVADAYTKPGERQPNPGLVALDKAIERDIEAQKFEYEKLGDRVDLENNLYAKMTQRMGNAKDGIAASRTFMKDAMASRMEEMAAKSQNKTMLNNAEIFKAQAAQESAKWEMETIQKPAYILAQQQRQLAASQSAALAARRIQQQKDDDKFKLEAYKAQTDRMKAEKEGGGGNQTVYSGGLGGTLQAGTTEKAEELNQKVAAADRGLENIRAQREMLNKLKKESLTGGRYIDRPEAVKLAQMANKLIADTGDSRGYRQKTKDERIEASLASDLLGGLNDEGQYTAGRKVNTGFDIEAFETALAEREQEFINTKKSIGDSNLVREGKPQATEDGSVKVVPTGRYSEKSK
jgi:hypothetical protein